MNSVKRNIVLTPGPATTTDTVKYAQVVPDICPREKEFGDIMLFISEALTRLAADPKDYTTVLLGGSGTAAVESIISSAVSDHETILIINNGAYGERICQIAKVYGIHYIEYSSSPVDSIDLERLEAYIVENKCKLSHLAVVHHETTTGLLNDVKSIGELCQKHELTMIVDAVSSFAAIPISMKLMNISFLASSANKNLQGIPGVSFVIAANVALRQLKDKIRRNLYLDLYAQYEYFLNTHQTRFTPPVQAIYALKQAIIETYAEGVETRYARYAKSWETLNSGLDEIGLKTVVPREYQSKLITSIIEPCNPHFDFDELHDYLYENGVTIYPGKITKINTFRVGNIGDVTSQDVQMLLTLLREYLLRKGIKRLYKE